MNLSTKEDDEFTTVERAYIWENGQAKIYERRVSADGKETFRKVDPPVHSLRHILDQLRRGGQTPPPPGSSPRPGLGEWPGPVFGAAGQSSKSGQMALWVILGTLVLAFGFHRSSRPAPAVTPVDVDVDEHERRQETDSGERLAGSEQLRYE